MRMTTILMTDDGVSGQHTGDVLALYDLTRQRLRDALAGQLPAGADLENTITAYAYWVCSIVQQRGTDWEATLHEYIGYALRDAARETEAEQAEFALLRATLRQVGAGHWLLDVGAGWGRMAPLYDDAALTPVYVEPTDLGARLMHRDGLRPVAAAKGERLPFRAGMFDAALIGWVLHHHSAELDAGRVVAEAARVLAPGGWLFSVEPLRPSFDMARWRELLAQAGIAVDEAHEFYRMPNSRGDEERYTLVIGQKPHGLL
jgi:SAM-dependent methyltransferase